MTFGKDSWRHAKLVLYKDSETVAMIKSHLGKEDRIDE